MLLRNHKIYNMKTNIKLPVLGISLLSGALFIAGCNNAATPVATTASAPGAAVPADAPAGSSAAEAEAKTGDHHGDEAHELTPHTHSTDLTFSSEPSLLTPGVTALWTLKITDKKTGRPVNDYTLVHDKLMHLIVVSRDLKWFNHLHPELRPDGKFVVSAQLPRAGSYKLYADYTPKGEEQEIAQHAFATAGETARPLKAQLVPDKAQGMWMVKNETSHPEGDPAGAAGGNYQVALMPMPMKLVAGQDAMLHFQVRDANGQPISDLQPYLGALGHCVILSDDSDVYLHSHPMGASMEGMKGMNHDMGDGKMEGMKMDGMKMDAPTTASGPDVIFHTNFPRAGLYKVWGQFKHKGKVVTAPFVVNVAAGAAGAHDGDENQAHAH